MRGGRNRAHWRLDMGPRVIELVWSYGIEHRQRSARHKRVERIHRRGLQLRNRERQQ